MANYEAFYAAPNVCGLQIVIDFVSSLGGERKILYCNQWRCFLL